MLFDLVSAQVTKRRGRRHGRPSTSLLGKFWDWADSFYGREFLSNLISTNLAVILFFIGPIWTALWRYAFILPAVQMAAFQIPCYRGMSVLGAIVAGLAPLFGAAGAWIAIGISPDSAVGLEAIMFWTLCGIYCLYGAPRGGLVQPMFIPGAVTNAIIVTQYWVAKFSPVVNVVNGYPRPGPPDPHYIAVMTTTSFWKSAYLGLAVLLFTRMILIAQPWLAGTVRQLMAKALCSAAQLLRMCAALILGDKETTANADAVAAEQRSFFHTLRDFPRLEPVLGLELTVTLKKRQVAFFAGLRSVLLEMLLTVQELSFLICPLRDPGQLDGYMWNTAENDNWFGGLKKLFLSGEASSKGLTAAPETSSATEAVRLDVDQRASEPALNNVRSSTSHRHKAVLESVVSLARSLVDAAAEYFEAAALRLDDDAPVLDVNHLPESEPSLAAVQSASAKLSAVLDEEPTRRWLRDNTAAPVTIVALLFALRRIAELVPAVDLAISDLMTVNKAVSGYGPLSLLISRKEKPEDLERVADPPMTPRSEVDQIGPLPAYDDGGEGAGGGGVDAKVGRILSLGGVYQIISRAASSELFRCGCKAAGAICLVCIFAFTESTREFFNNYSVIAGVVGAASVTVQHDVGGVVFKAFTRLIGTGIGASWACLAYACMVSLVPINYSLRPPPPLQYPARWLWQYNEYFAWFWHSWLLAPCIAVSVYFRAHWAYMAFMCMISFIIIFDGWFITPNYVRFPLPTQTVTWATNFYIRAGYRVAATCIGVGFGIALHTFFYPVISQIKLRRTISRIALRLQRILVLETKLILHGGGIAHVRDEVWREATQVFVLLESTRELMKDAHVEPPFAGPFKRRRYEVLVDGLRALLHRLMIIGWAIPRERTLPASNAAIDFYLNEALHVLQLVGGVFTNASKPQQIASGTRARFEKHMVDDWANVLQQDGADAGADDADDDSGPVASVDEVVYARLLARVLPRLLRTLEAITENVNRIAGTSPICQETSEVLILLQQDMLRGITSSEARARAAALGGNGVGEPPKNPVWAVRL